MKSKVKHNSTLLKNVQQIVQARVFVHSENVNEKVVVGNPASVVFCKVNFPEEKIMQQIAINEKSPMTAFVLQKHSNNFSIKYFTPSGNEFGICAHATLIASNFIYEIYGYEKISFTKENLKLNLETVNNISTKNKNVSQIKLPAYMPITVENSRLNEYLIALSLTKENVTAFYKCKELHDEIIVLNNIEALKKLKPNFKKLKKVLAVNKVRGLLVTALSENKNIDYEVRVFAPHFGIDEDISCGSANCSLLPLWHHLSKAKENKEYVILCPYNSLESNTIGGIEIGFYDAKNKTISIGGVVSK